LAAYPDGSRAALEEIGGLLRMVVADWLEDKRKSPIAGLLVKKLMERWRVKCLISSRYMYYPSTLLNLG
jgi:hypothetical protein